MSVMYLVLLQVCLTLLTSRVWTQSPMDERASDQVRSPVDFMPRKFLIRNSPPTPKGDSAQDYKMINTVLAQLEKARSQEQGEGYTRIFESPPAMTDEELGSIYSEYTESLSESERGVRHLGGAQRHYSICRIDRNTVSLNNEEYEYRPSHYEEIRCAKNDFEQSSSRGDVCSSLGFSCVQWNKTIHLTRRRYSSGCWETNTRIIPAGCECMWPGHILGDMRLLSCIFNMENKH